MWQKLQRRSIADRLPTEPRGDSQGRDFFVSRPWLPEGEKEQPELMRAWVPIICGPFPPSWVFFSSLSASWGRGSPKPPSPTPAVHGSAIVPTHTTPPPAPAIPILAQPGVIFFKITSPASPVPPGSEPRRGGRCPRDEPGHRSLAALEGSRRRASLTHAHIHNTHTHAHEVRGLPFPPPGPGQGVPRGRRPRRAPLQGRRVHTRRFLGGKGGVGTYLHFSLFLKIVH